MVKVNNENEVAAYHIIRILLATLFTAYVVCLWIFPEYFSWAGSPLVRVVGHFYGAFYVLLSLLVWFAGRIWFVEFTFKDNVYEFRYYVLTSPFGSKRMVRIPTEYLYAFAIKRSLINIKKELVLYQEKEGKLFEYPPIPIGNLFLEKQKVVLNQLKIFGTELKS